MNRDSYHYLDGGNTEVLSDDLSTEDGMVSCSATNASGFPKFVPPPPGFDVKPAFMTDIKDSATYQDELNTLDRQFTDTLVMDDPTSNCSFLPGQATIVDLRTQSRNMPLLMAPLSKQSQQNAVTPSGINAESMPDKTTQLHTHFMNLNSSSAPVQGNNVQLAVKSPSSKTQNNLERLEGCERRTTKLTCKSIGEQLTRSSGTQSYEFLADEDDASIHDYKKSRGYATEPTQCQAKMTSSQQNTSTASTRCQDKRRKRKFANKHANARELARQPQLSRTAEIMSSNNAKISSLAEIGSLLTNPTVKNEITETRERQAATNQPVHKQSTAMPVCIQDPPGISVYNSVTNYLLQPVNIQDKHVTINKPVHVHDSSNLIIGEQGTMVMQKDMAAEESISNPNASLPRESCGELTVGVSECINDIRDHYKHTISRLQPIPWCDWHEVKLTDVYTKLELEIRYGEFRPIQLEEVFAKNFGAQIHPRRILIRGDPGIGKSTLCRKLAYDWAVGATYMQQRDFRVVFLIEVRQLQGSIKDAIFEQLLPSDLPEQSKKDLWLYVQQNQRRVAIILDGIDELDSKIETDIMGLLHCRILKYAPVLVTSRPDPHGRKSPNAYDRFIVNKGYTLENAISFVHKYFKPLEQETDYIQLVEGIEMSPYLRDLATNPLNTILLCIIWQDNKAMPKTRCELYDLLEYSITIRFCEKNNIEMTDSTITECCETYLNQISEIAFLGIQDEKYRFVAGDVMRKYENSMFYKMGFMTEELTTAIIKPVRYLIFPHKSIQERFAAKHLMNLPLEERRHYLKDFSCRSQCYNVLVFASGFMKHKSEDLCFLVQSVHDHQRKMSSLLAGTFSFQDSLVLSSNSSLCSTEEEENSNNAEQNVNEGICLILECLYESECNATLAKQLTTFIGESISIHLSESSLPTVYSFSAVLQQETCSFKVLRIVMDEKCKSKWGIILTGLLRNRSVHTLVIEGCLFEEVRQVLRQNENLQNVTLKINKYTEDSVIMGIVDRNKNSAIKCLNLDVCVILDINVTKILQDLLVAGVVDNLNLVVWCCEGQRGGIISNDVMEPLSYGIKRSQENLKTLTVTVAGPEAEAIGRLIPICKALANSTSLQKFTAKYTDHLPLSLGCNDLVNVDRDRDCMPRKLVLSLGDLYVPLAEELSKYVKLSKIQSMCLSNLALKSQHGELLGEGLQKCQSLTELEISGSDLGDHGVVSVCSSLIGKPLKVLNLRDNGFSDDGLNAVIDFWFEDPLLEVLDISDNVFTESSIEIFGAVVKSMKALRKLGIFHFQFHRYQPKSLRSASRASRIESLCRIDHGCCRTVLRMKDAFHTWWLSINTSRAGPSQRSLTRHYVAAEVKDSFGNSIDGGGGGDGDDDEWFDCQG